MFASFSNSNLAAIAIALDDEKIREIGRNDEKMWVAFLYLVAQYGILSDFYQSLLMPYSVSLKTENVCRESVRQHTVSVKN